MGREILSLLQNYKDLVELKTLVVGVVAERDQLRALADTARDGMRQLGEDLEASRAEVERLRERCNNLQSGMVASAVDRAAAIVRAEAAEALVAVLRGALEEIGQECDNPSEAKIFDPESGLTDVAWVIEADTLRAKVWDALALTPASAGVRLKAEALREAATKICETTEAPVCLAFAHFLDAEADRLEKEAANGR